MAGLQRTFSRLTGTCPVEGGRAVAGTPAAAHAINAGTAPRLYKGCRRQGAVEISGVMSTVVAPATTGAAAPSGRGIKAEAEKASASPWIGHCVVVAAQLIGVAGPATTNRAVRCGPLVAGDRGGGGSAASAGEHGADTLVGNAGEGN